ncbi:MAG: hypothetical protein HC788_09945 [Sphingopyxis sp.]|nr:hypothetical protein [Sphingopyxis sp.]
MATASLVYRDPAFVARGNESELISALVRPHFSDAGEWLTFFCFDPEGRLLSACENGGRGRSSVAVTPVMVRAVISSGYNAQLLVAHNHPSGELRPSPDDLTLTRRIVALCELCGMMVSDHLILTCAGHFSFRQAGLL